MGSLELYPRIRHSSEYTALARRMAPSVKMTCTRYSILSFLAELKENLRFGHN